MADHIMLVCSLAGCSEEEARQAMLDTNDPVEAIDRLMKKTECAGDKYSRPTSRQRVDITEDEAYLNNIRSTMKLMDSQIYDKVIASNQPYDSLPAGTHTHHEERALQNSYEQQCQLPSVEEEAETPGTESQ
jgi:hypothetical protein